ncbi:MAG: histidinol dehydrogenase [Actinomycetota bacterium]|nr:histidinol dehydrogenase [Actinomycetota bacterium]
MLSRLDLRGATGPGLRSRLPRPHQGGAAPVEAVREILAEVRKRGDAAVREYTERFDRVTLDHLRVPPADIDAALAATPSALRSALEQAATSVEAYHRHQVLPEGRHERDGIVVRELRRAVDRAGAYVPGGRAGYPSTVLMTAVPARVAGVAEIVLCVPPGPDGRVFGPTLAAAAIAGVDEVYRIGGAQAVGAMAYGTESVAPVDVIVGPGNVYVAIAKREVAAEGVVGVPAAFAGPSEVVVVADASVPPSWAAVDVVVQAEHGPDGLAWLVTWDEAVADAVIRSVSELVKSSPRRSDIEATLSGGGYAVLVDGPAEALEVANAIAPEHLQLMCSGAESMLAGVRHAGAVFTGPWAPASVGDYLAGPSHVLPTFGSARFAGGLQVSDFVRTIHAITLDQDALTAVAPAVATLALAEGLDAHARSVQMRLGDVRLDQISVRDGG